MRVFIAIDLDPEIKKNLGWLLQSLRRTKAEVKWVGDDSLHLTLKFLGEVSEDDVTKIVKILEEIGPHHQPFLIECRQTGSFPEKGTPRVFWVGVTPSPQLLALHKEIESSLEKIGFPPEERAFHPHLTLGRIKSSRGLEEARAELEKQREKSFGQMEVKFLTLFQSFLRPAGAEYKVLREIRLG